jgi:hypothetical protein
MQGDIYNKEALGRLKAPVLLVAVRSAAGTWLLSLAFSPPR